MPDLGDRIRTAREALGLRQEDVAEILGINRNTVGSWETGLHLPRGAHLRRLREVLQLDADLYPIAPVPRVPLDVSTMSTANLVALLNTLISQAQQVSVEVSRRLAVAGEAGLGAIQHGKRPNPSNHRVLDARSMAERSAE